MVTVKREVVSLGKTLWVCCLSVGKLSHISWACTVSRHIFSIAPVHRQESVPNEVADWYFDLTFCYAENETGIWRFMQLA